MFQKSKLKNKIILVGIPGCGKTTLGAGLAEKLKLPFYDTDQIMIDEGKLGRPYDFFRIAWNGQFIEMQKKIITKLSKERKAAVISTGAEVALIAECADLMKEMGIIIHIQRDPQTVYKDLIDGKKNTMQLYINGEKVDRHKELINEYMKDFECYVKLADLILDNNGSEEEGVEGLIKLLDKNKKRTLH